MENNTLLILLALFAFLFLSNNGNLGGSFCGNLIEGVNVTDNCFKYISTNNTCTSNASCNGILTSTGRPATFCHQGKCAHENELANIQWCGGADGRADICTEMYNNALSVDNQADTQHICEVEGNAIATLDDHIVNLRTLLANRNTNLSIKQAITKILQGTGKMGPVGPGN